MLIAYDTYHGVSVCNRQ